MAFSKAFVVLTVVFSVHLFSHGVLARQFAEINSDATTMKNMESFSSHSNSQETGNFENGDVDGSAKTGNNGNSNSDKNQVGNNQRVNGKSMTGDVTNGNSNSDKNKVANEQANGKPLLTGEVNTASHKPKVSENNNNFVGNNEVGSDESHDTPKPLKPKP